MTEADVFSTGNTGETQFDTITSSHAKLWAVMTLASVCTIWSVRVHASLYVRVRAHLVRGRRNLTLTIWMSVLLSCSSRAT